MKKLLERKGIATYGVAQGCENGCCHFEFENENGKCSVTFPYQFCLTEDSMCLNDEMCCSNLCEKEEGSQIGTCADVGPHSQALVPKCEFDLDLGCIAGVDGIVKSIFGKK